MPITLNHSNIGVQYNTGSNYIIETVKSDLYLRDTRTDITSNLLAEPILISPAMTETVRSFIHSGGTEAQTTHTITVGQNTICDILIVGGGGSGSEAHGGGGGAGAVIFMKDVIMNGNYTIKIGNGGICEVTTGVNGKGRKGNDTEIFKTNNISNKVVAEGGGGGGQLANANGGSGGSGGGGDAYNVGIGVGGAATAYTPILDGVTGMKYGNNGGNAFGNPGHGGGGGGAGGAGENALAGYLSGNAENERAHGGVGIKSATINSINYDFKTLFGTNSGGVLEADGFLYFGGGGGNGRWSNNNDNEGGKGGLGGGGKGGWGTANNQTVELNGAGYPGINGTGGGGGGGGDNKPAGGSGGSGIVIIKFKSSIAIPEGNPITHKRLNFAFDSFGFYFDTTKYIEYQAQLKTGMSGWRIVRYLPPKLGRWYQGNYITTSTFTIPTIGTPYNYTTEWAVPFGTFDEMFFATFDMTYWLYCLKTSVLGAYGDVVRPVIKSSEKNFEHTVKWYNRDTNAEDPWISINNHLASPNLMLYGENSNTANMSLLNGFGGMCVLVRESTASTTILNPNTYTLNFPVLTIADINNNSNIVLQGTYDISLSSMNSSIIAKSNQYIPKLPLTTSNISIRYNLLNPVLDPTGAQWTYNSSNTNVYHMGSVGIGTKSPEYSLDVRGSIYSSLGGYTSSALTKWSVLSDRRIKENIVKASYDKCLENVKNIELYNFNFKDNCVNTNDRHQLGFIAQEVQQVYPKAVEVGKIILNLEEKIDDLLTLNITQIDYTLYGAVKSLIEKMENIKIKMEQIKQHTTFHKH